MLRIDLLPRHFAIARTNRILIALFVVLLVIVGVAGVGARLLIGRQIGQTQAKIDDIQPTADKTQSIEAETQRLKSQLQPIKDRVDFVAEADESGAQFWDRFHAINEYIYDKARVTRFSITIPSNCNFDVIVGDTTEAARFLLNLIRCPHLTNISISGLPAGMSIEGAGGAGGGFAPMGGGGIPGEGMMGEPGMGAEPGMMEGPAMGGPAMGGPPMGGGGGGGRLTASGEIALSVSAQLTIPVSEPTPPSGAAAAGGGGAGMGADMGMGMGPEMGMGPGGPPGAGMP
ncbi:MAG: PilN domain-containing protein, partial [Armatimonadota bacterium]